MARTHLQHLCKFTEPCGIAPARQWYSAAIRRALLKASALEAITSAGRSVR